MALGVGQEEVDVSRVPAARAAPAALPPGLGLPPTTTGGSSGRGFFAKIGAKVRSIKAAIERHVLWIVKFGLALICGTTTAATVVGTWVQAVLYWPLWAIYWAITQVAALFGAAGLGDPAAPAGVTLVVIFWMMAVWAIIGTCWDWECDRLEQCCLLLMCSVALGAGGTTGQFTGWMAQRGHDLRQATLGHLLG